MTLGVAAIAAAAVIAYRDVTREHVAIRPGGEARPQTPQPMVGADPTFGIPGRSVPSAAGGFSLPAPFGATSNRPSKDETKRLRDPLRQNPADVTARIQLAVTLDNSGEASEAEDVLRAALQRGQKTAEVYHALGMLYLRNQVYKGAADA